jgi:hypothetical protein
LALLLAETLALLLTLLREAEYELALERLDWADLLATE